MQYFILGMAALIAGLLLIEVMRGSFGAVWIGRIRKTIGILLLAVAAGLYFRGMAGPGSLLAALGFWLVAASGQGVLGFPGSAKTTGQSSQIRTDFLEVALDHDTGRVSGEVIYGPYSGRTLDTMTADELIDLHTMCAADDPPSAQVIETVLDLNHPDWRSWRDFAGGDQSSSARGGQSGDGTMSREDALEVLGLKPGASADEIRRAHRDLMQKVHPDHGGSTVLAAQINQAKEVLLG